MNFLSLLILNTKNLPQILSQILSLYQNTRWCLSSSNFVSGRKDNSLFLLTKLFIPFFFLFLPPSLTPQPFSLSWERKDNKHLNLLYTYFDFIFIKNHK
jgi:hypothetical protein